MMFKKREVRGFLNEEMMHTLPNADVALKSSIAHSMEGPNIIIITYVSGWKQSDVECVPIVSIPSVSWTLSHPHNIPVRHIKKSTIKYFAHYQFYWAAVFIFNPHHCSWSLPLLGFHINNHTQLKIFYFKSIQSTVLLTLPQRSFSMVGRLTFRKSYTIITYALIFISRSRLSSSGAIKRKKSKPESYFICWRLLDGT